MSVIKKLVTKGSVIGARTGSSADNCIDSGTGTVPSSFVKSTFNAEAVPTVTSNMTTKANTQVKIMFVFFLIISLQF
ncbi:hypothetical protein RE474_00100 [Methanolobus sediminis]|uniref:Uncharacterized protein n=1 Tax=Methanolobus sediminis TaxID=3072978 RepID=A0AA51UKN3_9EURY|nr:hypothetical protein [Methanolobus sediminis]WMW25155.1 hypothetical protein RE474_00100 [Methanolobus sediminis]